MFPMAHQNANVQSDMENHQQALQNAMGNACLQYITSGSGLNWGEEGGEVVVPGGIGERHATAGVGGLLPLLHGTPSGKKRNTLREHKPSPYWHRAFSGLLLVLLKTFSHRYQH